ncbi:MAG: hypothetical protein HZA53_10280 [Planctomycetes bacterium]|nr:hypothetical protein [Planctomycetota bacterium]
MHSSMIPALSRLAATSLVAASLSLFTHAQIVNPADKQQAVDPAQETDSTFVTGQRLQVSEYREEDRVGPYRQPEWTKFRRFPSTRVYVQPPGHIGVEWWMRPTLPCHGPVQLQNQYEIEFGLPGRFQLDLYLVRNQAGNDGPADVDEQKLEARWALADWDAIPWNPTLYLELANEDSAPDSIEAKLLLGDEFSPSWHRGANLVFEHEMGGALENAHELTIGVSHTLDDQRLSLGAELKTALINPHADRSEFEEELLVGPSLQYRPTARMHIDVATLVGIGVDSPAAQGFLVIGYEFWAAPGRPGGVPHAASELVLERGTTAGMPVVPRSSFPPA